MKKHKRLLRLPIGSIAMMLAMVACSSQTPPAQDENLATTTVTSETASPAAPVDDSGNSAVPSGAPGTPGGLPDDRTPLEEPNGPIDAKSAEAAGQVVQRYGGLLEQRKFAEARRLWGNGGEASGQSEAEFVARFDKYATLHSEVGRPRDMEGAAGSIYITVPFRLFGTLKGGGAFNSVGPLTLRRVNDVPGSTEEQRRWHIYQSGLNPRP